MKTKLFLVLTVAVLLGTNTSNAQNLTDTYWKNPKTGDWVIGFTEKHVIYDNAVWDIVEQTERKGGYTFTISNGSETKDIKVSPTKKEERMAFFTVEDSGGVIECLAFPKTFTQYGEIIKADSAVFVLFFFAVLLLIFLILAKLLQMNCLMSKIYTRNLLTHISKRQMTITKLLF